MTERTFPDAQHFMSSLGACRRQVGYALLGFEESNPPSNRSLVKMEMGTILEELVVSWLETEGHAITDRQKEVRWPDAHGDLPGHIDGVIDGDRLLEIKCLGGRPFQLWRRNGVHRQFPQYVAQAHGYMHALGMDETHFEVLNTDTGERHTEVIAFDTESFESLRVKWGVGLSLIRQGKLPQPDYNGGDWHCSPTYCRYSSICPSGQARQKTPATGLSGVSVIDGRGDPELDAAAEAWRDADEVAREAQAVKDDAKAVLEAALTASGAGAMSLDGLTVSVQSRKSDSVDKKLLASLLSPQDYARVVTSRESSFVVIRRTDGDDN